MLCKPGLSHNWSINCQSFSSSRSLLTDINSSFLRIVSMKYMHQLRILTAVVQRNECFRINKNSLGQLIVSCTSKQALSPYLLPMESFLQKWRNFYKQCEINSILKLSRNSDLKKNWTYVLLPSICLANNATQKRLLRLFSPTMSKRTPYYIVFYIYIMWPTASLTLTPVYHKHRTFVLKTWERTIRRNTRSNTPMQCGSSFLLQAAFARWLKMLRNGLDCDDFVLCGAPCNIVTSVSRCCNKLCGYKDII